MATRFNGEWISEQLHLPPTLVRHLLAKLSHEGLTEQQWEAGPGDYHYRITAEGRGHASRLLEVCGYVGPAPVSLEAYAAMLRWQFANTPPARPEHVVAALSGMILPEKSAKLAGLAVSSGRSLFLFGPAGNGKSSVGRKIHAALPGDYWIPHAVSVGNDVIRIFDEQCHQRVERPRHHPAPSIDAGSGSVGRWWWSAAN